MLNILRQAWISSIALIVYTVELLKNKRKTEIIQSIKCDNVVILFNVMSTLCLFVFRVDFAQKKKFITLLCQTIFLLQKPSFRNLSSVSSPQETCNKISCHHFLYHTISLHLCFIISLFMIWIYLLELKYKFFACNVFGQSIGKFNESVT